MVLFVESNVDAISLFKQLRFLEARTLRVSSKVGALGFWLSLFLVCDQGFAKGVAKKEDLWSLKPIVRPEVPQGVTSSGNPIDAFIAEAS